MSNSSDTNWLRRKELPYAFTLLIAAFVHQVSTLSTQYSNLPILVYKYSTTASQQQGATTILNLSCQIKNLSKTKKIEDITIYQAYRTELPSPKILENPEIITVAPSMPKADEDRETNGDISSFSLGTMQPDFAYILTTQATIANAINEYPKLMIESRDPVLLRKQNLLTQIIDYQHLVQVALILTWAILTAFYIRFYSNSR